MRDAEGERSKAVAPRIVPIFPLPNVFLFPSCVMPLHVFEPRYRQMVEDLLDGAGQLVMGTLEAEHGSGDEPARPPARQAVRPIGGLGEILRHDRLPDGRFLIWLFGLSRVSLREAPSDRLYRRVEIVQLAEIAPAGNREASLRERLHAAIRASAPGAKSLPDKISIACLADLLLQRLSLPQTRMQAMYEELDVEKRAEGALAAHATRSVRTE